MQATRKFTAIKNIQKMDLIYKDFQIKSESNINLDFLDFNNNFMRKKNII